MPPEIVLFYVDLGRPYGPLIERMVASARAAMPGAGMTLVTTNASPDIRRLFDRTVPLDITVDETNLCKERARVIVSYMRMAQSPVLFVDPDLEFRNPVEFGDFDVGLVWRKGKPDQPVNTGMILARPGCEAFWRKYGSIAVNLPPSLHGWWGDQLPFSLLTGVCREPGETLQILDARVKLISEGIACTKPDKASPQTWALHYKGKRKGAGWETYYEDPAKFGGGKLSPASA